MSLTLELDLEDILSFTIALAREAGAKILSGRDALLSTGLVTQEKHGNVVDLVTAVDKEVEDLIRGRVRDAYPDHALSRDLEGSIGEETYSGEELPKGPVWIVDDAAYPVDPKLRRSPIDGTTNFIHGFPFVATSIGLAVDGMPVIGVVFNPFLDLLYSAARGHGAFLNETTRLPRNGPAPAFSLSSALIGSEWGLSRTRKALASKVHTFGTLLGGSEAGGAMVHGLRNVGSAALNVCLVAAGNLDLHWETGCWVWDVCAGICILKEAGGACFGAKGTELTGEPSGALITGRKYLFIRGSEAASDESRLESQIRLAESFHEIAEEVDL